MKETSGRSEERHGRLQSPRCPDINSESRDIPANKIPMKPVYAKLMSCLEGTEYYKPILVDTNISATDKYATYRFFNNLELPCCVHLYVYHAGSQLGNIDYIWKKDRCPQQHCSAMAKVKSSLPVYMSRAMRKAFSSRYQHVKKLTPAVLRSMYRYLTDDCTFEPQSAEIDKRLELLLDDPDIDLIVDKRELNSGRQTRFWKGVDDLLEEYGKAADDRRHGPDVAHLPVAISIPDLIRKVADKLPTDTPIPSEPWVRFQFWPRNRFSETAKRYSCRFDVKYKVQKSKVASFTNPMLILDIALSFFAI